MLVKTRNRALVAAAIAAVAATALGGCSSSTASTQAKTLTVWDPFSTLESTPAEQQAYVDFVSKVDAGFEKTHPGVTIKHSRFGYDGYDTKLAAAVAANSAPDIAWDYTDIDWKLTDPINSRLTSSMKNDLTLLNQSVVSAQDHKLHILPFGTYQGVWVYNKALFAKAGVTPPKTQAQWLSDCDKFNSVGVEPTKVSFNGPYKMDRYAALYASQYIPNITNWNDQSIAYTSPQYTKAVDAIMDGLKHKCFGANPQSAGTPGDSESDFLAGKAAMMYNTSSVDMPTLEKAIGKGNVGVMLQPALAGGHQNMDASLEMGLTLMKTSKQKDLAWEYMQYFVEPQNQTLAWNMIQQVPNSRSANVTSTVPVYKQLLAWSKEPRFQVGAWPVNPQESYTYAQKAPAVVAGNLSVKDFLTAMQAVRVQTKPKQ